jgi:transcriptional regulator with XRE-family HTH domain
MNINEKIKSIRTELGLSQEKFAALVDIPFNSYRKYERDVEMNASTLQKIASAPECQKYVLWLVSNQTNAAAGQVAPGDSLPEVSLQKDGLAQVEFDDKFVKTVGDSLLMFCHLDWFVPNADKVNFDDCGKIILKDVRSLIESRYQTQQQKSHIKSA